MSNAIPIVETYRGVGIHDRQPRARIENVVKVEVDRVHSMGDADDLAAFAEDVRNCPEAQLFTAAKIEALWQLAAEGRRVRPTGVDIERVQATVAGLDSQTWRSPTHYCSILDPDGAVPRGESS